MSDLKYCQGVKCHTYRTKDRIRGTKGNKFYQTRRRSSFYYLGGNACSMACERDWFEKFGEQAINHFGKITEPKKLDCNNAWYKEYDWRNGTHHYFVNDLLGQRIPITREQYNDENLISPN
jgi:hypothetical protein